MIFELNDIVENRKRIKKALCKLCDKVNLACSGGISDLHDYLKAKHLSHLYKDEEKKQLTLPGFKNCPTAQANNITMLVTKFLAREMHPISTIDGNGFQQLVHYMEPGYKLPSCIFSE